MGKVLFGAFLIGVPAILIWSWAKGSKVEFQMMVVAMVLITFNVVFRSDEHTSELQSLMRISYAVFCLKNKIMHPAAVSTTVLHDEIHVWHYHIELIRAHTRTYN